MTHTPNLINEAEISRKLKSGEITLDNLLYPGRMLHDIDLNKLAISTMDSGFPSLDSEYLLLKEGEGELIIVGGRPSMGKSGFMFQLAQHVSVKHPVHVFSLEMSQESIVRRLISAMINRPITAIQRGYVERNILQKAKDDLKKHQYFIDDSGSLTADEIADRARIRHRKYGTKLIVIDYLQIIKKDKGHTTAAEYGEITAKLKALGKELRCPIIVGSQLNRQCELREDKKPILSDLKESGAIEQDSDMVLTIHREYRYSGLRPDEADIIVLKNRNGAVGEVAMKFYAGQCIFKDLGPQDIV